MAFRRIQTPTILFVALLSITLFSYSNEEFPVEKEISTRGKKLQNPFSVQNMRLAFENINKSKSAGRIQETNIRTTHLYIKVVPKNWNEYDALRSDSAIFYEDYPIDYEILHEGTYHDPTVSDSLPTYQYTSIPISYTIPNGIEYEILEELYLPREDSLLIDPTGKLAAEVE
jgi:hypothetical protein